jgi:hypothetical protein
MLCLRPSKESITWVSVSSGVHRVTQLCICLQLHCCMGTQAVRRRREHASSCTVRKHKRHSEAWHCLWRRPSLESRSIAWVCISWSHSYLSAAWRAYLASLTHKRSSSRGGSFRRCPSPVWRYAPANPAPTTRWNPRSHKCPSRKSYLSILLG